MRRKRKQGNASPHRFTPTPLFRTGADDPHCVVLQNSHGMDEMCSKAVLAFPFFTSLLLPQFKIRNCCLGAGTPFFHHTDRKFSEPISPGFIDFRWRRNCSRAWAQHGEAVGRECRPQSWEICPGGGEVFLVTPGGDTARGQALLGAAGARRGAALGNASLPERRLMPALERKPKQSFPFKPRFQNKTKGEKKYVKKTL